MKDFLRWFCAAGFSLALAVRSRPYDFPAGTALILAPHADDETLGCAGLIAAKCRRGHDVRVAFITDSAASHPGHPTLTAARTATLRRAEALAALQLLGVPPERVYHFDVPDGSLNKLSAAGQLGLVGQLVALIRATGATEIFAPYRDGGSSEHTAVQALAAAAGRACGRATLLEYPVWAWWNPFRLRSRLAFASTNYRLRLGADLALKRRALACHRTQLEPQPPETAPALPPILARLCCTPREFFFQRPT
ncbi:MAG: PIG-L family deacetylase [Opitutae bacterium]|nr:PIG-L family deacetylase [Opitutae bacterium]